MEKMRIFFKFIFEEYYSKNQLLKIKFLLKIVFLFIFLQVLKRILELTQNPKDSEELANKCLLFSMENSKKFPKAYLTELATQLCLKFIFSRNLKLQ